MTRPRAPAIALLAMMIGATACGEQEKVSFGVEDPGGASDARDGDEDDGDTGDEHARAAGDGGDLATDAEAAPPDASDAAAAPAEPADAGLETSADGAEDASSDEPRIETGPEPGGCAGLCGKLDALQCPADDLSSCVAQCETVIGAPCGETYGRLSACSLQRPPGDFHCEDGNAVLNDGICLAQQQAWADCLVFGP